MRRLPVLWGLPLMMLLVGCGNRPGPALPGDGEGDARGVFTARATEVARTWRTGPGPAARDGYIPLQDPTVLPGEVRFDDDTRQAFLAGWYREQIALPDEAPPRGTVRFADGSLTVPLVSAREAYRQLDQGDPPPCPGRPRQPPPAQPSGPDGAVSSSVVTACLPLTVTGVTLGTATVHTTRGTAEVPAWLFTVEELGATVARLAVAPSAVGTAPQVSTPAGPPDPALVAAQDLTAVRGAGLTVRLGVGACDRDPTPLVLEQPDVVVVAGTVTRGTGVCTDQLLLVPVTVNLRAPLGGRPVLDAVTGQPLILRTVP